MTYEQALDYLASLNRFGINLGLSRIEKLLALMGNPERCYKTVHITGTNGKGSTTAMIASILNQAGIRTGMYTSPHLSSYTERMMVNGKHITEEQFAEAIEYTSRFVEAMIKGGEEHPTEFEVITAAAFYYFAAVGVEYAVIEVGLGGLLDSTNVLQPQVAVITNVALEHTDRCGDTLEAIAGHKAGIIKTQVPVVTAAEGPALEVIRQTAQYKRSEMYVLGADFSISRNENGLDGQLAAWECGSEMVAPVRVRLLGAHQLNNAALAIMASILLRRHDTRISKAAIGKGLAEVVWPGRFEVIAGSPPVVIDGAHNPAGAKTLRHGLDEYFPQKSITFVLGILRDKDRQGIIDALLTYGDSVITVAPDSDRASEAGELLELIMPLQNITVETAASTEEAIAKALTAAGAGGVVCIAGSLYLAGPAREFIYNKIYLSPVDKRVSVGYNR